MNQLPTCYYYVTKLAFMWAFVSQRYQIFARTEYSSRTKPLPGIQYAGQSHFEDLQMDFTEVKSCTGYSYVLVFICTHSGFLEAFHTRAEKSH